MVHCRHFGVCGGCTCLDLPADVQLQQKTRAVEDLLRPFLQRDHVEIEVGPAARSLHFRSRALQPVQPDPDGRPQLGIYQRGSHAIVTLSECQVQVPALTEVGRTAGAICRQIGIEPYDERTHTGTLRAFGCRLFAATGELLLGIVSTGNDPSAVNEMSAALQEALQDQLANQPSTQDGTPIHLAGIVHNIHRLRGNALLGRDSEVLTGTAWHHDRVAGIDFRVRFESFYQLHRDADDLLYRPLLAMLGSVTGLHIVDAFGGVGTIGLRLAQAAPASLTIVESSPFACADARDNAGRNPAAAALGVDVQTRAFCDFSPTAGRIDLLVVDPNRAGLQTPGCDHTIRLNPERILYASCKPQSLARDLTRLTTEYRLLAVKLADLFPHTDHVEVLALMQRRS